MCYVVRLTAPDDIVSATPQFYQRTEFPALAGSIVKASAVTAQLVAAAYLWSYSRFALPVLSLCEL